MSSTPYTLMRCRMKDLISCFNICKVIEKDDESSDHHHNKPTPSSSTSSNNNINIDDGENKRDKKQMEAAKGGGGFESPASWQSCESEEEDEYIVFYFKNDETGGDVIEEIRGLESSTARQQNVCCRKKHEKGKMQPDAISVSQEIRELKEPGEHMDTLEVSSDSSTSSFAFPAIQREWPGSPILMPRPEGHDKARSVCIQCCKF